MLKTKYFWEIVSEIEKKKHRESKQPVQQMLVHWFNIDCISYLGVCVKGLG